MKDELKVTLVQTALFWENRIKNLEMLANKIGNVEAGQLVLLPEMFSTGFTMNAEMVAEPMDGETVSWMREISSKNRIVLGGSLVARDGEKFFNRFVWMLPTGEYTFYDKRHLFAYAGEDKKFTKGRIRKIVSLSGWRINLQVCYDLRFPVWARQRMEDNRPEYDVLIYVANWPEKRSLAWKSLLVARAIENQCYVLGVNRVGEDGNGITYSGDSMVVDPLGEIVECRHGEEAVVSIALSRENLENARSKFPFLRDADMFDILT